MQQPTHPRLHLRDAHDAHVVFEAVARRQLVPITRRLNEAERRDLVRPGAVFVWFEAEDDSGLMRWTDGRSWGQSRMREPYLFYDEKMPYDAARAANEMNRKRGPAYRFIDGAPRSGPTSSAVSHQDRTAYHHAGLVKQAYSAWVSFAPDARPQKWHITAYFTYADLPHLPTVDHYALLRDIPVPVGRYRSSHSRTRADLDKPDDHPDPVHPAYAPHPRFQNTHPRPRDDPAHAYTDPAPYGALPSLASLAHPPPASPSRSPLPHGVRLPEDQRLIHMLNSRHVR